MPAADAFYTKQIAYSFAPLFIVGVSFAIWRLIACARKEPWRGERDEARGHRIDATATTPKDRAVLTLILLLYMIYPTICQQTLSMLACRRVEAWQYLSADLEEPCWRDRHLAYVLILALPQVILYVFGLPLLALFMMFRNRNKLGDHVVKFRYGMLFSGYRVERYYWEVLVAMRKAFIIILSTFGALIQIRVQTHIALFLLMAALVLHAWGKPFLASSLQQLEGAGLVTCWFTMWCGLLFYQEGLSPTMGVFLTIVIVLVNVAYMIVIVCFLGNHPLREQAGARPCTCRNRVMEVFGDEEEEFAIEMTNPNVDRQQQEAQLSGQTVQYRRHFSIKHNLDYYENPLTGETTWEAPQEDSTKA